MEPEQLEFVKRKYFLVNKLDVELRARALENRWERVEYLLGDLELLTAAHTEEELDALDIELHKT